MKLSTTSELYQELGISVKLIKQAEGLLGIVATNFPHHENRTRR